MNRPVAVPGVIRPVFRGRKLTDQEPASTTPSGWEAWRFARARLVSLVTDGARLGEPETSDGGRSIRHNAARAHLTPTVGRRLQRFVEGLGPWCVRPSAGGGVAVVVAAVAVDCGGIWSVTMRLPHRDEAPVRFSAVDSRGRRADADARRGRGVPEALRIGLTVVLCPCPTRSRRRGAASVLHAVVGRATLALGFVPDSRRPGLQQACEKLCTAAQKGNPGEVPVLRPSGRQGRGFPRKPWKGRSFAADANAWDAGKRFTSYERIDEIPYMVVKKDGSRERFERQS